MRAYEVLIKANPNLGQPFLDKVDKISAKLGINPNWLLETMHGESGFNPKAQNAIAGGLIGFLFQYLPSGFQITKEQLLNMSAMQQLDYVYRFYTSFGDLIKKVKSYEDLHLLTFYPAALGKPDNYKFPAIVTKYNPTLDTNKDGYITIAEVKKIFRDRVYKQYAYLILDTAKGNLKNLFTIVLIILIITSYGL
jgi:hypothetical protein